MTDAATLLDFALHAHESIPPKVYRYLNDRGIPNAVADRFILGWNGERITIPIYTRDGEVAFFKLAKGPDPEVSGPKSLASSGSYAELYGWEHVQKRAIQLVICEGEFDRLVLEAHGIAAATSTGGAGTFRAEWAEVISRQVASICVCFDRDEAGRKGAIRVAQMIPDARVVELPDEVGEGGDITDFFVRLGRSSDDFHRLLEGGQRPPPPKPPPRRASLPARGSYPYYLDANHLKGLVRIEQVVSRYVKLTNRGYYLMGRCPFHEDRTPSFALYPQNQRFYCYGCRVYGDVIEFLMRAEKLSFRQTLERLRSLANLP